MSWTLRLIALSGILVSALAHGTSAQDAPPQAPRTESPGMFESIGRFFDQGAANIRSHLRGAKQRVDEFGDRAAQDRRELDRRASEVGKGAIEVTKGAVDAVVKLPGSRVMTGRENCSVAPNGAPDCVVAAEALCRKHGFASGASMDFTQAEECPPRALVAAGKSDGQCRTVTFINRAMCQ